jgi:outer membrane receptor protein involved in Fe transport
MPFSRVASSASLSSPCGGLDRALVARRARADRTRTACVEFRSGEPPPVGAASYPPEQNELLLDLWQCRDLTLRSARASAYFQPLSPDSFGQSTYKLSSRVSLTGGVRYTDEQKDLDNTGGKYVTGTAILNNPESFYDFVDSAT